MMTGIACIRGSLAGMLGSQASMLPCHDCSLDDGGELFLVVITDSEISRPTRSTLAR